MENLNQNAAVDTESTVRQFKEFLQQYNKLSEYCFGDCVTDFTTRKVLDSEESCALNCLEKFLKMTQRISLRFQEHQLQQSGGINIQGMTK
ncbi:mitochondrial import inner membrane translocase subunit Tim9-like [Patella vulgata]|uniref:mitochondrial import inner membrane translocase subunit Tim9-like n=1 Tax=Patella vulgata TaxID=6465 RepID=UPI0024A99BE3|nr:mitochondrial import inner membrane translocase subunit Tim9-like [Patella vulgata]XP_055956756.1 mitochondrial import inner membrane translocase subunit Tim9-like [Patella vulgata]XP_055956757.1 mitochondrial import inner membrane translocase subunit Tim9-like [Patella vulgata]XP_055956758.1 mitochondrial import inner membrane translocase subunit Tim9-like [Patella vulgata]